MGFGGAAVACAGSAATSRWTRASSRVAAGRLGRGGLKHGDALARPSPAQKKLGVSERGAGFARRNRVAIFLIRFPVASQTFERLRHAGQRAAVVRRQPHGDLKGLQSGREETESVAGPAQEIACVRVAWIQFTDACERRFGPPMGAQRDIGFAEHFVRVRLVGLFADGFFEFARGGGIVVAPVGGHAAIECVGAQVERTTTDHGSGVSGDRWRAHRSLQCTADHCRENRAAGDALYKNFGFDNRLPNL